MVIGLNNYSDTEMRALSTSGQNGPIKFKFPSFLIVAPVKVGILTSVSKCCITFGPARVGWDSRCNVGEHFYSSTWIESTQIASKKLG